MVNRAWIWAYATAALVSLAYEIVWIKWLAQMLGASHTAISITLSVYITGVAVGGWSSGRLLRRAQGARRSFIFIQLFVGVWCALLPVTFGVLDFIYGWLAPASQTVGHQMLRIALCGIAFFPPSAALGAVYPVLSGLGPQKLFSAGTAGSVVGVLFATLFLLPVLGLRASLWSLAVLNIALAIFAARNLEIPSTKPLRSRRTRKPQSTRESTLGIGGAGAALFMAQGVWFGLVWLLADPTAYAEGLVIATVLISLAAGSELGRRFNIAESKSLGFIVVAQSALIVAMPLVAQVWIGLKSNLADSFAAYLVGLFIISFLIVGPACLGYGALIPSYCRNQTAETVGRLWGIHHIFCAIGMLAGGFLVVPLLGLTWGLTVSSLVLIAFQFRATSQKETSLMVLSLALATGVFGDATFSKQAAGSGNVLMSSTAGGGLVEVVENREGHRRLMSSRLRQEGGDAPEQVRNEILQGKLPTLLHPSPKNMLVIGLGTGISLRGALTEDVEKLTCVELSPGVIEGVDFFAYANAGILHDKRVRLVAQDGRNFIRLTDERFDLIVQELFFPYRSGVGSLYTVEHFSRIRSTLSKDGVFAQWISLAQIGRRELKVLTRTFTVVFPESSAWIVGGYLLLVGSTESIEFRASSETARYFLGSKLLRSWADSSKLNTENNLHIEHSVPRAFNELNSIGLTVRNLKALLQVEQDAPNFSPQFVPFAKANQASQSVRRAIIARFEGNETKAISLYEKAFAIDRDNYLASRALAAEYKRRGDHRRLLLVEPGNVPARFNLGVEQYRSKRFDDARVTFRRVLENDPQNIDALFNYANALAQCGNLRAAERAYSTLLERRPDHADASDNLTEVRKFLEDYDPYQ